jgi:hypothetical protein
VGSILTAVVGAIVALVYGNMGLVILCAIGAALNVLYVPYPLTLDC